MGGNVDFFLHKITTDYEERDSNEQSTEKNQEGMFKKKYF